MRVHRLSRSDDRNIHHRWNRLLPPVLTVAPGDEVVIEARSGDDDQLRPDSTVEEMERIRVHALSGPIYIEGAEPGDTLAIRILELVPASWGFTLERPARGLLEGFPPYFRAYELDLKGWSTEFGPGIRVPLRPFLGVMGVAPEEGDHSTHPPGSHGGNLDCRDLVAGTTLYLPVLVPGALFSCGDGHAAQGDGEVCGTALECAMTARLGFDLLKGRSLSDPQMETPEAFMTLSAAPTLEEAARRCLAAMLDLITERTGLSRSDAYALASIAVDLRINQVVNRPMAGVRAVLPKAVLQAG